MARPWSARCYGVARQREGSRQNSIGPALTPFITLYAREGADGQAVVCPLLRGSSPTRWVAPKQHRGSGVLSLRHFSGWFSLSLGAWVPKNLARRSFGLLVSAARCCSTGSGRLGGAAAAGRTMERSPARSPQLAEGGPALTPFLTLNAREGADGQAVVCPLLRGSSPTRWVAPKQHRGAAGFRRHGMTAFDQRAHGQKRISTCANACTDGRPEGWSRCRRPQQIPEQRSRALCPQLPSRYLASHPRPFLKP